MNNLLITYNIALAWVDVCEEGKSGKGERRVSVLLLFVQQMLDDWDRLFSNSAINWVSPAHVNEFKYSVFAEPSSTLPLL